jgi:hypothetical protein
MNVSTWLFSMKKFFQVFQFVVFLMCYSVNEPTSLNEIFLPFFPICFLKITRHKYIIKLRWVVLWTTFDKFEKRSDGGFDYKHSQNFLLQNAFIIQQTIVIMQL